MIEIYCDGSCSGNPGMGGFGVIVIQDFKILNAYSGSSEKTTNNRMELEALIKALDFAITNYKDELVKIYSDSAYCVNIFNSWIHSWYRNDWKNSSKKTVENLDLVKELWLFKQIDTPNFSVEKIKGHSGIIGNELADAAATKNSKKFEKIFLENHLVYK